MKKSFWVIFGIVLFILILIVALAIFLILNKSDALEEDQIDMAKTYEICMEYRVA